MIVILLILLVYNIARANSGRDIESVTVCDKERAATDEGGEYRIYTERNGASETYVMKDVWFVGGHRTDTADEYGKLKEGTTYDIHVIGWRVPLFSSFPNLMKFTPSTVQILNACG